MNGDEWRVEIDLDDEQHGYSLGERFRAHDLDDEARKRLGRRAIVSRDGPRVFLYTGTEAQAREAERIARELVAAEDLTADIDVTRWDPNQEQWVYGTGESAEAVDDEPLAEGNYAWLLTIELGSRGDAAEVEKLVDGAAGPVHRRWHYVTVDVRTEEEASELAERIRADLPEGAQMWVEANPEGIPNPAFVLLESRL